ncbi:SRPBCC family protein [Actinoplanes sp. NPDC051513]|uniref:SRPBCC family protein n=1 Tax=Actinoplanes sp. NPDC051513 TaxID=3363908 RepID=UPI0037BAC9F0
MASIIVDTPIALPADAAWAVIGDWATGPSRMAPGWVTDVRTEDDHRIVTFVNGAVFRERFIGIDQTARRLAYAISGDAVHPDHHNASMQILPDGPTSCRLHWIQDVLPHTLAVRLETGMTASAKVIKSTLESSDAVPR